MFKEIFTGGRKVQQARRTIDELEDRPSLGTKDAKRLRQARRVTRRHALKLGGEAIAIGTVALAGGGAWLLRDAENSNEAKSFSLDEIDQEKIDELAVLATNVYNESFGEQLEVPPVELVTDYEEYVQGGFLFGKSKKHLDGSGESIQIFKPAIENFHEIIKNYPEVTPELERELVEYVLQLAIAHEIVHWSAVWDRSEPVLNAMAEVTEEANVSGISSSQLAGMIRQDGYVDGAAIRSYRNTFTMFDSVEEAEAVISQDYMSTKIPLSDKAKKFIVDRNVVIRSVNQECIDMYRDLLFGKLGFTSEEEAARALHSFRNNINGREVYYRLISDRLGGEQLGVDPIYFGVRVINAINNTDTTDYNLLTSAN